MQNAAMSQKEPLNCHRGVDHKADLRVEIFREIRPESMSLARRMLGSHAGAEVPEPSDPGPSASGARARAVTGQDLIEYLSLGI